MTALSPSPAHAGHTSAASSIMRPIQTHVRVLGYPEYFHYSRDRTLTLSRLKHSGSSSKTKGVVDSSTGLGANNNGGGAPLSAAEDPLAPANVVCAARLAHLHPYGQPTDAFFEAVVAPCVESALSGQSFVFLVAGPGRSGRSQTVYGDNSKMKGLVELTAERLLQMTGDGDFISRGNLGGGNKPQTPAATSPSAKGTAASQQSAQQQALLPQLAPTVTYSCYGCAGNNVFETTTNAPVELREFPAPMGVVPLPRMRLLEIPRHAVAIPKNKNATYFTQFQIVRPLMVGGAGGGADAPQTPSAAAAAASPSAAAAGANARRCAQATITFVDLVQVVGTTTGAASPDLMALIKAVAATSGGGSGATSASAENAATSPSNAGPQFGSCALTRLLEQCIVGTTTMVPIATVTGLADFFDDTTATLRFVESFGAINQVLTLTNIVIPSWLRAAYEELRASEAESDAAMAGAYEKGCYDAYTAVAGVLGGEAARSRKEAAVFDGIAAKVAELRAATHQTVQDETAKVAALIASEAEAADAAEAQLGQDPNYLHNQQFVIACEAEVRRHEALIAELRSETEAVIADCKSRIAAHTERTEKREREFEAAEAEGRAVKKALVQRGDGAWGRRADDVAAAAVVDGSLAWVAERQKAIAALEAFVTDGSRRARNVTAAERTDRELRARLLRITQLERQAAALRSGNGAAAADDDDDAAGEGNYRYTTTVTNGSLRSRTPPTSRGHGHPPAPPNANSARRASVAGIAAVAPTSRYLQPTSASAQRRSTAAGGLLSRQSLSPSVASPSRFTTSSTRGGVAGPAAVRPSTATAAATTKRTTGASSASPFSKALSITTNAVVSVQSIFGSKFGRNKGAASSAPASKEKRRTSASPASAASPEGTATTTAMAGGGEYVYHPERGSLAAAPRVPASRPPPTSDRAPLSASSALNSAGAGAHQKGSGSIPPALLHKSPAPFASINSGGYDDDDDDAPNDGGKFFDGASATFIASP